MSDELSSMKSLQVIRSVIKGKYHFVENPHFYSSKLMQLIKVILINNPHSRTKRIFNCFLTKNTIIQGKYQF